MYVIAIQAGAQSAALLDHARIHGTGAEKRKRKEKERAVDTVTYPSRTLTWVLCMDLVHLAWSIEDPPFPS